MRVPASWYKRHEPAARANWLGHEPATYPHTVNLLISNIPNLLFIYQTFVIVFVVIALTIARGWHTDSAVAVDRRSVVVHQDVVVVEPAAEPEADYAAMATLPHTLRPKVQGKGHALDC